jgi:selenocysteine lyase/cysteine desulfurase
VCSTTIGFPTTEDFRCLSHCAAARISRYFLFEPHQPQFAQMNITPHFPIYMDHGATTPVDPRVIRVMVPWLGEHFGNPASRTHAWGWEAENAVEKAREQVAQLIGADAREIVWTSGATE